MATLPTKLFNPAAADRVAVVSAEPVHGQPGMVLLRLSKGPRSGKLAQGTAYGPYAEADLPARAAELVAALRQQGYGDAEDSALRDLFDLDPAKRGRAALRLGWRGGPRAADALLAALPKAVDDACPILDALGMTGDPRAAAAVRPHAARKLLSRRRSAVEALRNLGNVDGLAEAVARSTEQLPPPVRAALAGDVQPLVDAVRSVDPQRHGLCADLLYEIGTPAAVAAVARLLDGMTFGRPFVWRYVKSILKRAMLRRDYPTWGRLQHAVERQGLAGTATVTAVVKSGYDGVDRETPIFSRRTRDYVRRAGWRYLRRLAQYRPDDYAPAAAEAVVHYSPADERPARGLHGAFADAYLLTRVLFDGGDRLQLNGQSMRFRFRSAKAAKPAPGLREERYPDLWDRRPEAYVRLLAAARLVDVHEFAHAGLARGHAGVIRTAAPADLLGMLDAPYEPTVALALAELGRRFDPAAPDLALLARLAGDDRPAARDLGHRFLRDSAGRWTSNVDALVTFLTSPRPETRALAADLTLPTLAADAGLRRTLAPRLLVLLRTPAKPGAEDDGLEAVARLCRDAMLDELAALVPVAELLAMIGSGSPSAAAVAGDLLGRRADAVADLGLPRIVHLANHPLAAVRAAAMALVRAAEPSWRDDPSVPFALVESDWTDVSAAALDLVRTRLDFTALGMAGVGGLLDSNRPDVQDLGVELARRHLGQLDPVALAGRLAEHPSPHARPFALELVTGHLPPGPAALAAVARFCRTVLLDTRPIAPRAPRRAVIAILLARGLADAEQAAIALDLLGEAVRFAGRADFERALDAVVRLKLAHPQLDAAGVTVGLPVGGAA